jgi:hypothetical protein
MWHSAARQSGELPAVEVDPPKYQAIGHSF